MTWSYEDINTTCNKDNVYLYYRLYIDNTVILGQNYNE